MNKLGRTLHIGGALCNMGAEEGWSFPESSQYPVVLILSVRYSRDTGKNNCLVICIPNEIPGSCSWIQSVHEGFVETKTNQIPSRCCSLEIEPCRIRTATSHGSGKWELPAINTSTPQSGLSNWQTTPSGAGEGWTGGRV